MKEVETKIKILEKLIRNNNNIDEARNFFKKNFPNIAEEIQPEHKEKMIKIVEKVLYQCPGETRFAKEILTLLFPDKTFFCSFVEKQGDTLLKKADDMLAASCLNTPPDSELIKRAQEIREKAKKWFSLLLY